MRKTREGSQDQFLPNPAVSGHTYVKTIIIKVSKKTGFSDGKHRLSYEKIIRQEQFHGEFTLFKRLSP